MVQKRRGKKEAKPFFTVLFKLMCTSSSLFSLTDLISFEEDTKRDIKTEVGGNPPPHCWGERRESVYQTSSLAVWAAYE